MYWLIVILDTSAGISNFWPDKKTLRTGTERLLYLSKKVKQKDRKMEVEMEEWRKTGEGFPP